MNHRIQRSLWFSALLLVGLGLRLLALDLQPLWWDEGFSLYFATEPPARLLELTSLDIHPPLYYLLLQAWLATVGIGAVAARWLSVLLGVLALPVAWWVARPLVGRRAAWIAAGLLALSPFHIYYSQEVRMYSLMTLLALGAVGAWQWRRWALLGGVVLAGLLTQYYFACFSLALALLIVREVRAGRYGWAGPRRALAVATLGYLPWLVYALPRLIRYVGGKVTVEADVPLSPLEFLPRHLVAWSVGHLPPGWGLLAWAALPFVALLLLTLHEWATRPAPRGLRFRPALTELLILWAVPTLCIFLVGLRAPFVAPRIERQLLFVLPFFLMLVARGVARLWQRWSLAVAPVLAALVLANLATLWGFYTLPRYPGEDYRPLLARVGAAQGPGDLWLAIYEWQIGYLRAYLPDAHPRPLHVPIAWADDAQARQSGVAHLLSEHPRLWFPAYQVRGRLFEEELARTLAETGARAWDDWQGNTRLYLFASVPEVPPLGSVGNFEGVGEVRAAALTRPVPTGIGVIPLFFDAAAVPEGIRASVQLVGRGSVWGEWDGELASGAARGGLPVAPGTPPGEYAVQLTLYQVPGSAPLNRSEGGQPVTPEATLGVVSIVPAPAPLPAAALRRLATTPLDIPLGGQVRLLGFSRPDAAEQWQQGDAVPLTLFWQKLPGPTAALNVFIQALAADGTVRAARDLAPVNGTHPPSAWGDAALVRDPHLLDLPADMPAGTYRLVAGLYDPATGQRLAAPDGRDVVELGPLDVTARPRTLQAPTLGTPTDLPFGDRARLARVELPDTLDPTAPLEVTLVWQATATGGPRLRAFAQLFHGETQIFSSDHALEPPASAWQAGEWIVDRHTLPLPAQLAPGSYRLLVGLYDATTRAPLGDAVTVREWQVN